MHTRRPIMIIYRPMRLPDVQPCRGACVMLTAKRPAEMVAAFATTFWWTLSEHLQLIPSATTYGARHVPPEQSMGEVHSSTRKKAPSGRRSQAVHSRPDKRPNNREIFIACTRQSPPRRAGPASTTSFEGLLERNHSSSPTWDRSLLAGHREIQHRRQYRACGR